MKMIDSLKPRDQVDKALTWDLSDLFANEEEFETAIQQLRKSANAFLEKYQGQLNNSKVIIEALKEYEDNKQISDKILQYAGLKAETDMTNEENLERQRYASLVLSKIAAKLSFFKTEILVNDEEVLREVSEKEPQYKPYVRHLLRQKPGVQSLEVEKTMADFRLILDQPLSMFEQIRSNDLDFKSFMANGQEYPLSFVLYEEFYMYHPDIEVRRQAYKAFSNELKHHQNGMAAIYYTQVEKEKVESHLRNYDTVIDWLLQDQEVDSELYHRQIDTIMERFAPVMRKYITHVKEVNGLDEMFYADLKMDLDSELSETIMISESEGLIAEALAPLGEEYVSKIMKSYSGRWIDFPRNLGKRTGASCSSVYGQHPYVILSWSDRIETVYTLIHELGHAGQAIYSNAHQPISAARMSLYTLEAPSTFNELLLTDRLLKDVKTPREERNVLSTMISKTYFHNFVTHLLEATYQRRVYDRIDKGKSFSARKLNQYKREVLEEFWGDTVTLEAGTELTWMRQRHYYRGLYPYTYSAGLTIATQAYLHYKEEGQAAMDRWLEFIKLGGSLEPIEAAAVAGVDIGTDQALIDTIDYLDSIVDRIIELTAQINKEKTEFIT